MTESLSKTDDLIRQATEQAKASNQVAQQAKRQAGIAANTLESEERPWMGFEHVNMPTKIAVGSTVSNSLVYKNWGKGPAIHLLVQYQMGQFCGPFPIHPPYRTLPDQRPTYVMPGQPIETKSVAFEKPLTDEDIAAFKQPSCDLYLHARATYRDKGFHQHWRHFCGEWDKSTESIFLECGAYNDGDEDYPDGKEP